MKHANIRLKNRDLSWLAFNHRVLQEAADPTVPLYERIKFMAIWSSNLDEFFRVRVASLRALQRLKKKTKKKLDIEPDKLLARLLKAVTMQQEEFGALFRARIKRELNRQGIFIVRESELREHQVQYVLEYGRKNILPAIRPHFLRADKKPLFLENRTIYLVVRLRRVLGERKEPEQVALVCIPSSEVPRFLLLPASEGKHYIMFLDDVIRLMLQDVFPHHEVLGAYAVKLTRDAELYIDDEFSGDLLEKVKKAISKRSEGVPSRFLYDSEMSRKLLNFLTDNLGLKKEDLVMGSRYHNFNDFFGFPNPKAPAMTYDPMPPFSCMPQESSVLTYMRDRDILAHYPYHSYECVIHFLREAADDPRVASVSITLYRLAKESQIAQQLIRAAKNGKRVTAFVEVKARFDEESNIRWAEEMEKAGATVLYSIPNLKVHAKLCLVSRTEEGKEMLYAYLSTGNFNESAATLYTDFGFFTCDRRVTSEVAKVFSVLRRDRQKASFEHLLVSPFTLRQEIERLIAAEIRHANNGKPASIIAKMNSLEDPKIIAALYNASAAGVKISLIVRGICCLIPGVKGMSENIEVISIVDRFLEHSRVFVFHNGGDELYYLSSADWMRRNLDRRIEVCFPVYEQELQRKIRATLDLQLRDTVKARVIDKKLSNRKRTAKPGDAVRSQEACFEFWRKEGERTPIAD